MNIVLSPSTRLVPLFVCLFVLFVAAVGIGSNFMPPERVLAALMGEGPRIDGVIVWTLRLPRVLMAVLAGAALALAGALLQRVVRNPMASPSVLGITDGAAVGVVLFLWLFSDQANNMLVSIAWQPVSAVVGAAVFGSLVMVLAISDPGGNKPLKIILYGIALAALAKAMVTLLIIVGPVHRASHALTWLTGSVGTAHWHDIWTLAGGLCTVMPILFYQRLSTGQMILDSESARTTGLELVRSQFILLAVAVLLTALAVAHVGAIGFVGLVAPHAAGLFHGQFRSGYLLSTALTGSLIVLGADTLARTIAPPLELPAGALSSLVGAPLFLYLLVKARRHNA